jgi:hypothetical protein
MNNVFIDNLWRWKCGMPEVDHASKHVDLKELRKSEWSVDFERLMRNRLVMGAIRYGCIGARNKPKYDRVRSMTTRLNKYLETGNKEFLVDVANLCLLEFVECHHPKAHFSSVDDGEHVKIKT